MNCEGVKNTRRGRGLNCVLGSLKNKTQSNRTLKVERKRER
jgi:hypothetical protein